MPDFVAIDYSKLPKPQVILELNKAQTLSELKDVFKEFFPEYTADLESDLGRALLEVIAFLQIQNKARMNYDATQTFAALADGNNLDNEAANWGVKRQYEVIKDESGNEKTVYETDDSLRRRRLLAPEAITTAGSRGAYLYHIYTAGEKALTTTYSYNKNNQLIAVYDMPQNGFAAQIKHAEAITPAPGIVHFSFIVKDQVTIPAAALSEHVLAILQKGDVVPLTDKVEYITPKEKAYKLFVNIHLKDGAIGEIIRPQVESNLNNYIEECRRLGGLVDLAAICSACRIADIADVDAKIMFVEGDLSDEFNDLQAEWFEFPKCAELNLKLTPPQYNRPSWQDNWMGGK